MKDDYVYPRPTNQPIAPGMELRDWFAGMAMQGILSHYGQEISIGDAVMVSFTMAIAMMKCRDMNYAEISEFISNLQQRYESDD